ncbi:7698_t:CDS:2 [Ambispora leptoticha]|uniref:tRNA N(3)-methylcytidine methyltransferase n=1 Tax=Ambispora leptoticha TaxID=144679 RepID=A0A9N8WNI9_9GLOM|nr:7698_t:CDS:2 [Ambispora leptoticha]
MNVERETKAKEILSKDVKPVGRFWVTKYKNEAAKNWDLFYKRNKTNFFKDRHWISREFEELSLQESDEDVAKQQKVVLELGCGVGNFIFPILDANPFVFIYACDFSKRAIQFIQNHEKYKETRCHAFVADITKDPLNLQIYSNSVDIVTAIFVASAIPPEQHSQMLENIKDVMKPGGIVCFRDYAIYDETQLRFSAGGNHKLEENLYVRQDGTMSYFFSIEYLTQLFEKHGFKKIYAEYVERETTNRAQELTVDRVFLQAKFVKL